MTVSPGEWTMTAKADITYEPNTKLARRQIITGFGVAITGLGLFTGSSFAASDEGVSHTEESIHQETVFKVGRSLVYQALTDTKRFDKVTKLSAAMQSGMSLGTAPTEISTQAGGPFTLFGGHIVGRQIELVPNERIVQAWRVVAWEPGIYSIVRFQLADDGSGTKLVFDHTGFPHGQGAHLAEGWRTNYWEPLGKALA